MFDSKKIKPLLNQNIVEQIISSQGFEVKNHFFKIRRERTASASIASNGYIKDFGGEFSGDVFAFLQEIRHFTFKDALEYVANFVGYTEQSHQRNTSIHNSGNVVNLNEIANKLRLGFVQNKQKVISQLGTLFHPNFFEFFGTDKIEKFVGFCERKQVFGYMFSDDNGVVRTHCLQSKNIK